VPPGLLKSLSCRYVIIKWKSKTGCPLENVHLPEELHIIIEKYPISFLILSLRSRNLQQGKILNSPQYFYRADVEKENIISYTINKEHSSFVIELTQSKELIPKTKIYIAKYCRSAHSLNEGYKAILHN